MIELEVKYSVKHVPQVFLSTPLEKQSVQADFYYDTPDYTLLRGGNFLRIRNEHTMDFKMDVGDESHLFCKETTFETQNITEKRREIQSIFTKICLPYSDEYFDLLSFLEKNNLVILAPITKKRKVFKVCDVKITLDDVEDLGIFIEAEKLFDEHELTQKEAQFYKQKLIDTLISEKIIDSTSKAVNVGYVELYLLKHNPKAYNLGKFKE